MSYVDVCAYRAGAGESSIDGILPDVGRAAACKRRSARTAICTALAALATISAPALAAGPPPTATGAFTSRTLEMPANTAMAFRGKSTIDKSDAIIVAVTNGEFLVDMLSAYYDRRRAIEQRFKDNDNVVVYLEFKPDGAYRGLSYYFGKGNNCGFCGGGMGATSTVKLAGSRMKGTFKMKDESRNVDMTLDVPVLSSDYGPPLPPDGGAPGKAYMAYHDALVKRDATAIRPLMSKDNGQYLDAAVKKGKTAAKMSSLASSHPDKSVRITQGFSKGSQAVLLIAGETSVMRLAGEVVLVNEGGKWRVDDELTDVVLQ